ncbi:MAG: CocE/NonD family hydrolase [Lentisphaeria bacterium]|jgi:hypothetical protein
MSVLVPMPDGVRLAVDVYLPAGHEDAARHPTLLLLTRYMRSRQGADGKPVKSLIPLDEFFIAHGYALVKVDLRGSGASFGHRDAEYGPAETQDGKAILDWVVSQPWCDGKVGAYGNSYTGTTAEFLAASRHPALKAVAFSCSDFDIYRTACWPYGLYCKFIGAWSSFVRSLDLNKGKVGVRPVTADADGKLLAAAIAEHESNINVNTWILGSRFRDQPAPGFKVSLAECGSLHWRKEIEASKVPMLVFASWLDGGTAIGALERLQYYSNPQKLVMMASTHGGKALASPFVVGSKSLPPVPAWDEQVQMRLDFFDQYLRGIDRGVASWPKVRYFHMGEEKMRATDQWPPAGTAMRPFYFGADHVLAPEPAAAGSDDYEVDFGVSTGRTNRWYAQTSSPVLNLDHREKMDERMLLYTSEPLEADLEVTGSAVVHLWCSTDRDDGAFLVYLEDVDADGQSRYVTEGGLRGLHRKVGTNPDHPQSTPFHSFAKNDAAPMKPGETCELAFELMPTSVKFARGHRLRIALAGADSDSFERVPAKGPAKWRVARGPEHPSRIELPVVAALAVTKPDPLSGSPTDSDRPANGRPPSSTEKKLLVVSTSTRNRFQASIDAAEKALVRLSEQSGAFTLEFVRQPSAPQPKKPKQPAAPKPGASEEEQAAYTKASEAFKAAQDAYPEVAKKFQDEMKQALQKLSPESLKNYDGVVFCYTSGDLPLPDFEGFLAWIKAGHAFIGLGNAMETMVSYPDYYDMLGGKWIHFKGTQRWIDAEIVNPSPQHPASKGIPAKWTIREFSYKIPNFVLSDPAHTQELLIMEKSPTDQAPGHYPLAWCRDYGRGRVFFTSLGGNRDLWDENLATRKNPPATAKIFQAHLLGGILWALGLEARPDAPAETKPGWPNQ